MSDTVDFAGAEWRTSSNFGPRRDGSRPDIILLHYTGMATGKAAEDWLCDPKSEVSAHYIVHEDGRIVQMVREEERAWHAGQGIWKGKSDINSRSIGIEIVNEGHEGGLPAFPDRQIEAVIALCCDIAARHVILPERVLGHSDVAPGRKVDPGERFPWAELAAAGIGHFVEPSPPGRGHEMSPGQEGAQVREIQELLAFYGYGVEVHGHYDPMTREVVAAFQRHFRPARVDGIADPSTRDTLERLIGALDLARRQ
jgi:N-acetylmuramoyl-L-alanine amidase